MRFDSFLENSARQFFATCWRDFGNCGQAGRRRRCCSPCGKEHGRFGGTGPFTLLRQFGGRFGERALLRWLAIPAGFKRAARVAFCFLVLI